jgi:hypothetical protein
VSLVLLSLTVLLTNVANVYDPLKYRLHWRCLLAKPSATATLDCTCIGHLGRCDTDRIVSISCHATQGNFHVSLVLLSPMVSLSNVANVYDPLKYHLHWRCLLAKPSATLTLDCTCIGHLGRCDTDRIVSISCRATQGNFRVSPVLLSPTVSLTNVANVYDPLKYHLHWRCLLAKPSATATLDCNCIGHLGQCDTDKLFLFTACCCRQHYRGCFHSKLRQCKHGLRHCYLGKVYSA